MRLRIDELASLWMETPTAPVQVSLLVLLEPTGPDPLTAERLSGVLADRAEQLPALRRRIRREGPDHAEWVADPSPPADRIHLDTLAARTTPDHTGPDHTGPGDVHRSVWRWAADRAVGPLPADQPPWRILVTQEPGTPSRVVLLITAHHALVDGMQGLALVRALLDAPVDGTAPPPTAPASEPTATAPLPSPPVPTGTAWQQRLRARWATAGCVLTALAALRGREPDAGLPRTAGTGRRLDVVHRPLEPLRHAARESGVTLSDVVLAAVASALRELCATGGPVPPDLTLRATVPIAHPGPGQAAGLLVARLPVGEPDPGRRLALVVSTTAPVRARIRRVRSIHATSAHPEPSAASHPRPSAVPRQLPGAVVALIRGVLIRSRRWGEAQTTAAVTVLRGPVEPWSVPGARVTHLVPIAPLSDRMRISVTALSYAGTLGLAVHTGAGIDPRGTLGPALGHALDQVTRVGRPAG